MEGDKSEPKSCCSGGACGSTASSKATGAEPVCKCGDDWTCEVTKVESSEGGEYKPFYKCNEGSCECVMEVESKVTSGEKGVEASSAYCECGKGYKCTFTKKEGGNKTFFECGNGCKCEISGNKVSVCYT